MKYVALLRGINVGGKNILRMTDLKSCFQEMQFREVSSYIQSGNVLFTSEEKNLEQIILKVEKELNKKFNYSARVVILTHKMLEKVVEEAPSYFGKNPKKYRYDVLFPKNPLTPQEALKEISTKEGVDEVHAGTHALYFSRLFNKTTQSHLSRIIRLPLYQNMTLRNWSTTTKLISLMERVV